MPCAAPGRVPGAFTKGPKILNMNASAADAAIWDGRQIARHLARHCAEYKGADRRRSITQILTTAVPFLLLSGIMWFAVERSYWYALVLTVPTAGLLVRFFIIQHDCGHGSFFRSRLANDIVGRMISLLTLTPYDNWRRAHAIHHATSGNLAKRGSGDITTLTVREYEALTPRKRLLYRFYRNPFILLVLGPPFLFLFNHRLLFGPAVPFRETWPSVFMHNVSLLLFHGALGFIFGWWNLLLIFGPVILIGSSAGVWLFFIQHQFEDTVWEDSDDWDFHIAALRGSSYYVLPKILQWFTGNIGLHHIHHLNGKIPNYRLQQCLDASPELQAMSRLTFRDSLKSIGLALWDEDRRKLVSFRNAAGAA